MELGGILAVVKRWWWTLLTAMCLAGLAGYAIASQADEYYESRVRLLVGPVNTDHSTLRASDLLTRTYAELVTSQELLEDTISNLGLPHSVDDLREAIRPTADGVTRLLIVRVIDRDPELSALIANDLATQLSEVTSQDTVRPEGQLTVVDAAVPGAPIPTRRKLIVAVAIFAGAVGGFALVLSIEYFSHAVREERELTELSKVDFLGSIAAHQRRSDRRAGSLVIRSNRDSERAAAYRLLATKIELLASKHPIRSLAVLGAKHAAGTGELAANISAVLAERDRWITVVDANASLSEVSTFLDVRDRPGLTELLEATGPGEDARALAAYTFQREPGLTVMPLGQPTLGSRVEPAPTPWLVEGLLQDGDFLLVDAASVDQSPSALMWARAVDATLLVVHRDEVHREELQYVVESLRIVGANLIGTVFDEGRPGFLRHNKPVASPLRNWTVVPTRAARQAGTRSEAGAVEKL